MIQKSKLLSGIKSKGLFEISFNYLCSYFVLLLLVVNLTPKKFFENFKYLLQLEKQKLNNISLDEKEANRRERFVQTYLILFGLLLSYNQITVLQTIAMSFFIIYLFSFLFYYSFLTSRCFISLISHTYGAWLFVYTVNFMAFLSSFAFCYILMLFFVTIGDGRGIASGIPPFLFNKFIFYPLILLMSIMFGMPLFINRDMIIDRNLK